jgi:tRNA pseudouridine38-40 synthase
MSVGAGHAEPEWVAEVLAAKDRSLGGVTARPYGLYLVDVEYDDCWGLPEALPGPLFFPEPVGGL